LYLRLPGASLPQGTFPAVKTVKGRGSKDLSLCIWPYPLPLLEHPYSTAAAAEFLAESLKFMAGAALRSLQMLVELFTYRPAHESWAFIQDMALICVVLGVLIYASKWVANWTRSILHHRNETAFLIVSILIAGLILEEIDQHKYQREWEEKHRVELGLPAKQVSGPPTPR
jgi:hypothetical protein